MDDINIVSKRVILRRFDSKDLEDLYYYSSNPEVANLSGYRVHKDLNDTRILLKEFVNSKEVYAIAEKHSDKAIGSISIRKNEKYLHAEKNSRTIGFVLNQDYWNQGIMTEVVTKVIDELFDIGISKIYLGHFHYNDASRALINKLGFKYYMTKDIYIFSKKEEIEVVFYYMNNYK